MYCKMVSVCEARCIVRWLVSVCEARCIVRWLVSVRLGVL